MTRSILFDDLASESHKNADMLSLGDNESEKYSDIEELLGNTITTRSSAVCNTDKKKPIRGMKSKSQTTGFHEKKHVLKLRNLGSNAKKHRLR